MAVTIIFIVSFMLPAKHRTTLKHRRKPLIINKTAKVQRTQRNGVGYAYQHALPKLQNLRVLHAFVVQNLFARDGLPPIDCGRPRP